MENTLRAYKLKHILVLSLILFIMNYILTDMAMIFKVLGFVSVLVTYIGNYWAYLHNKEKLFKVTKKISFYLVNFILIITLINIVSTIAVLYDQNLIEGILEKNEVLGKFIYFGLSFLTPYIVVISEPLTIMSGNAVFDPLPGFLIGYLGTVTGIFTLFLIFRFTGDKYINRFLKEKDVDRYRRFVAKNEGLILTGLFIFPVLPDGVICGGAGVSSITWRKFLLIAAFSKGITVMSYTFLVEWLDAIKIPMEIWGLLGGVVVAVLLVKLYKRRKQNKINKA